MTMYTKRFILAVIVLVGCFVYVFMPLFVPGLKQDDYVTGIIMTGGFSTLLGFYFGSSDKKGKGKDE